MSLGLNFGGIEVMKNFGNVGNLWCLLDELWLEFWGALKLWSCGNVRIYLCIGSTCRIFILLSGKCRIFFFFSRTAMEKFGSCVWTCEKFWLWWNFVGALIFCCGTLTFFLGAWESFGYVILVMGIFWTRDFGHGKFFGHVETLNETSLEFTWWGLVVPN